MRPSMLGSARLRYSSAVKVTWDGNSLVQGAGADSNTNVSAWTAAQAPLLDSGATTANLGVGGQTTRQMSGLDTGSTTDVDGAFTAGKKNILIVWEVRNSIWGNGSSSARSSAEAMQDMRDYIAARRVANAWHAVILLTALPSSGTTQQADSIDACNAYMRSYYRDMGADLLVDVQQPGSPFRFRGDVALNFQLTQSLWSETSTWTHLNSAGYTVVAGYVASVLRRVKA